MRVLITRPREDSVALEGELHDRDIETLLAPMLVIRHFEEVTLDLEGVQGLLFTSSNGVRAFASLRDERDLTAWCVGDETARTARKAGFGEVHSAAGNVDVLAEYVSDHARPENGRMIHVAGSVSAGDLAGALRAAGFAVDRVPLYEAVTTTSLDEEVRAAFLDELLDGVLFFSPRTAATFVSLVKEAGLETQCGAVDAFCLSPAVARLAEELPWRHIHVAAEPTRAALLAVLDTARNRS
jgi:uroporphyrinogen-III synthase